MFDFFIINPVVLGICFWRKGRGNPGWAEYMGEKGDLLLSKRENKLEQDCRGDILDPHEL